MKTILAIAVVTFCLTFAQADLLIAQGQENEPDQQQSAQSKPPEKPASQGTAPKEQSSVTDHTIHLNGKDIPYKATAGTLLLKNDQGDPTALMFYVAYTRSDVKDESQQPVSFLYNGGPGSASVWLHMGAYGPRRVVTANAQPTPPPPYNVVDNQDCLLDKTDLVFIDAVGTGFSHAVGKAKDKDFWGVDQDMRSFGQFIERYVNVNNRWNSPKFLIGESYGTFRSAAVGNYLQSHYDMDLNGIVLMSSVLDLGTISFNPGNDYPYIFYVPSYAATAWYYKALKSEPEDLNAFLTDARQFAATQYADALMKGSKLSDAEKHQIAQRLSQFIGLSEDYILKANLRVSLPQFTVELQRNKRLTTGRLDARFSGPLYDPLAEYARNDPQENAISGAFAAAFNTYLHKELKFSDDSNYVMLSVQANEQWDWKHHPAQESYGFPGSPNVEGDLINAMITNTHLRVQVENGFFDLATPFFATEFTMDHLGLPADLENRIDLKYYDAGHMMYLYDPALTKLKTNVEGFIDNESVRNPSSRGN